MQDNPERISSSDSLGTPSQVAGSWVSTILKLVAAVCVILLLVALLLPTRRHAGEAARRNQCSNKLKQIGLALLNYQQVFKHLPPAYTTDADGKPLHSWRTLILPFLEEIDLYNSIDKKKPWDDPVNAELMKRRIDAYLCPSSWEEDDTKTTYMAVVIPGSAFRPRAGYMTSEFTDDHAFTLMVIEVDQDHAVPWMAPIDADEKLLASLASSKTLAHSGSVMGAVFADGSVRHLPSDIPLDQLRALITIAGKDDKVAREGLD